MGQRVRALSIPSRVSFFEENTQSLYFKLCSHIDKVHDSVLSYVGGSIEKI